MAEVKPADLKEVWVDEDGQRVPKDPGKDRRELVSCYEPVHSIGDGFGCEVYKGGILVHS